MFEATKIVNQSNDWITIVFLAILLVLVSLKIIFKERFLHTNKLFLSKKYVSIYFNKDKGIISNIFQPFFFVVQLLALSLLFYLINSYFIISEKFFAFNGYILIFSAIGFYFCLRFLLGLFLAYLFDLKGIHKKITFDKTNYFNNLVLWILPFLMLSIYSFNLKDVFIKILILLFVILLIIRYSLVLLNNKKLIFNNLFYFILYLCALEIAPLVIILKLTI